MPIAQENTTASNEFRDEEVRSNYEYPSEYTLRSITEQDALLRKFFPGVGFANEKIAERELPEHADGWFAIPKWQSISSTYGEAVGRVLDLMSQTQKFWNCFGGPLGINKLRQTSRTTAMFNKIGDEQSNRRVLVVPAQFGILHRGRSARRARDVMVDQGQFGLGAFAVGIMLLTHSERLAHYDDLWIDCSGDELDKQSPVRFSFIPRFIFSDCVRFDAGWYNNASDHSGSATGFVT